VAGALGLLLLLAGAGGAADFDYSRYRPARLRDVAREDPGHRGVMILPDVAVRTRVTYLGEFRELPGDSVRLIRTWGASMGVSGMLDVFRREAKLRQGDDTYWLPVQDALANGMAGELRAGEEIEVFVIHIGRIDGRPVFLVNAYDHDASRGHRR
jgi:hypothetical protein